MGVSAIMRRTANHHEVLMPVLGADAGETIVLATGDPAWAALAATALGECPELQPSPLRRVPHRDAVAAEAQRASRLWIVDEEWVAPLLARRRLAPESRLPELLVRFEHFTTARVVAMIESGARGCLPREAGLAETREAVRAVLAGELWLSRRLFSAVLEHMQSAVQRQDASEADDGLTERQREIVRCVGRGMSNKQIGRHLGISPTTVKTHLHNIFERLGIGGRTMLALRANSGHLH
jgi:RNA polymerase sigma factor (sigma-70 family)